MKRLQIVMYMHSRGKGERRGREGGGGVGRREKREGGGKGGVRGEKRRRERVYGRAFIIRNVIEYNQEWINKCVLDKPR